MSIKPLPHPDFVALEPSWELALRSESYADNSVRTYLYGLRSLRDWAAEHRPGSGPADLARADIRAWLVWFRDSGAQSSTARKRYDGAKRFYHWALDEGEVVEDPFLGVPGPVPNEAQTPTIKAGQVRELLATCSGRGLMDRRDNAILRVFYDCGVRLAEITRLDMDSVDLKERMIYVVGKGAGRRGARRRAVPFGVQTARALDRYLRERRKVSGIAPESGPLWVSTTRGGQLGIAGMKAVVKRRGAEAGILDLHPHALRHTWASSARRAGLSEGDLMYLGGWSNRAMLDRYGKIESADRAQESYRSRSVGDQL